MVLEKTPAPVETAVGAQDVARETLRSAAARRAGVGGTRREKSKNSAARARFMFFAFRPLKIAPPPVPPHPPPIVSRVCRRRRRRQRGTRGNSFYGTPARMSWARHRVTPTEKRRRYAYMYARAYFVLLLFLKASRRPVRTISASNTTNVPRFRTRVDFFFSLRRRNRVYVFRSRILPNSRRSTDVSDSSPVHPIPRRVWPFSRHPVTTTRPSPERDFRSVPRQSKAESVFGIPLKPRSLRSVRRFSYIVPAPTARNPNRRRCTDRPDSRAIIRRR